MGAEGVGSIASHPSGGEGVCEGGGACCAEGVRGGGRLVAVSRGGSSWGLLKVSRG